MSVKLRADREALEKLWQQGLAGKELLQQWKLDVDESLNLIPHNLQPKPPTISLPCLPFNGKKPIDDDE